MSIPIPVPVIVLVFRHSDYATLHDRGIKPAVKLARIRGLKVQGPVFLPTANMVRSAHMLVRGPAEELVRYIELFNLMPKYGVQVDIRLERITEMVGTYTNWRRNAPAPKWIKERLTWI